ncbi:MAG TPA: allantoicase [Nocardioidaceae bacterium]|nr:allantoicase [Nocardioidaceae bacterium]
MDDDLRDLPGLPDVASRALGGSVVHVSDELFAAGENLIRPEAPAHDPAAFGARGKVYDGWETRRRRTPGNDIAIVRLGVPSVVESVVVDTAYFTGNFPAGASVEALDAPGRPSVEELLASDWAGLVARVALTGNSRTVLPVDPRRCTHVRLSIYPDGGVARLRVHGRPSPDPALLTGTIDLAALENGGDVVECSDMYYASARNLLMPGRARTTGEGWENARRRDDGHDFVTVRLAGAGRVRRVVVDTSCFVGNAPGEVAVLGCAVDDGAAGRDGSEWRELVARTRVQPDLRHVFPVPPGDPVTHVRLEVFPDGGLARLRVHGELV